MRVFSVLNDPENLKRPLRLAYRCPKSCYRANNAREIRSRQNLPTDRTVAPRPIAGQPETPFCFFSIPIHIDCDSVTNGTPPQITVLKRNPDVPARIFHY